MRRQKPISVRVNKDTLQRLDTYLFNSEPNRNRAINQAIELYVKVKELSAHAKLMKSQHYSYEQFRNCWNNNPNLSRDLQFLLGSPIAWE